MHILSKLRTSIQVDNYKWGKWLPHAHKVQWKNFYTHTHMFTHMLICTMR